MAQINQFLENPRQPRLHLTQDDRWIGWLISAIMLSVGGPMVLLPPVVHVEFDRTCGTWILQRRSLFGHQKQEYRLRDITDVSLEVSDGSDDDTYGITLQLASGEIVPLSPYYTSSRRDKQEIVQCLRQFLRLPTVPEDEVD